MRGSAKNGGIGTKKVDKVPVFSFFFFSVFAIY